MSGWILAIDVGTTSTAAARRVGDRVETIQLQGGPRMPSLAFWREGTGASGTGRLVLGVEAEELSTLAPWCLERAPKSRLGEEFIQLGDKQLRPVEIIAAILREVHNEAMALSGGEPPDEIRLTHPARWQKSRLAKLGQAASMAGLGEPTFVPEPVAAAVHFASERLAEGEHVAVYDLGGGTLDTAVLKRHGSSFTVVGRTGGDEELGGEDFDDLLYRHLGDQLPGDVWEHLREADASRDRAWAQANRELLRHARRAKEGLSRSSQYEFYLPPPVDRELEANVTDFERLIAPTLRGTVAELERTILAAGLQTSDLAAIYLAGGSSRIPLVGRLIQERLGVLPEHLDDPKSVIALGAARLERAAARDSSVDERPLSPEGAAIPPLPGAAAPAAAGAAAADPTDAVAADPNATEIDVPAPPEPGGRPMVAATPGPGDPVPPTPGPGAGAGGGGVPRDPGRGADDAGPEPARQPAAAARRAGGSGGGRGRTIAAILGGAAVVAILAAVVLLGGGGGGDPTTTTTTTDETTPEEELATFIPEKFRDSCVPEKEQDFEVGAQAGIQCDGPPGFVVFIESFESRRDLNAAFKRYAATLDPGGCSANDWGTKGTWYRN
ncbi:MAG: Hsp70 family protein, partial [Thermoleophilia bacterium]|nr:Hsp70 family protein [Thermoleophilia bacterium]